VALELAKAFAAAEPATVLLHLDLGERKWEIEAREPGGSHLLGQFGEDGGFGLSAEPATQDAQAQPVP
jgi:hypothetical protein